MEFASICAICGFSMRWCDGVNIAMPFAMFFAFLAVFAVKLGWMPRRLSQMDARADVFGIFVKLHRSTPSRSLISENVIPSSLGCFGLSAIG
jgi:hypothetical protein